MRRFIAKLLPTSYRARRAGMFGAASVIYPSARVINNLGKREAIRVGSRSHIKGELLTFGHGGEITMGDDCFVGEHTYIWSGKRITIGNRVLISHQCNIFDNDTHPLDPEARARQFHEIVTTGQPKNIDLRDEPVTIADDVLIGAQVIILKGVTIGRGAVVAAGSVVTHDVPPSTVVAGNPARIIRQI